VVSGLTIMILMIPVNAVFASRLKWLQIKQMKFKDERIKLMNEVKCRIINGFGREFFIDFVIY